MQGCWIKFCKTLILCGFAAIIFVLLSCTHVNARSSSDDSENMQPGHPSWGPDEARPKKFDWIQLTSDEWLKGELKALYEDKLEFDSDKMGLLSFDWKDIKQVRGYKRYGVRIEGRGTVFGYLKVIGDSVFVTTNVEEVVFDRSRLIIIAVGEAKEIDYWSAKATLGLNVRSGNSDQINYNANASVKRRTSKSRFYSDYLGVLNESYGTQTANNHRVSAFFDIFITGRFFWRPVFGEYFQDKFSNIEYTAHGGTGAGYYIIRTPKTKLDISSGLAFQRTKHVSSESGEDKGESAPAMVSSAQLEAELTDSIDLDAVYRLSIVDRNSGRFLHHAKTSLEIELTKRLDLDLSFVWDRIQNPKKESDGNVPNRDDLYFFFGLGFEF